MFGRRDRWVASGNTRVSDEFLHHNGGHDRHDTWKSAILGKPLISGYIGFPDCVQPSWLPGKCVLDSESWTVLKHLRRVKRQSFEKHDHLIRFMMTSTVSASSTSSPDPLSMSRDTHQEGLTPIKSPFARQLRSKANTRRALRESSPNISRTPSPDKRMVRTAGASSPAKQTRTMTFSTTPSKGKGQKDDRSPWRIKVTVETEPEVGGSQRGRYSNDNSRTITVPLRRADEPSPAKRRRRVQRNSEVVVDSIEQELAVEESPKKGRGRPRKSLTVASNTSSSGGQVYSAGRRDIGSLTPLHERVASGGNDQAPLAAVTPFGQRRTTSQKISQRPPTPRRPANFDESTLTPSIESSPIRHEAQQNGIADKSISDPTGLAVEDDTVALNLSAVESEGFSMVSLESLRSHREQAQRRAAELSTIGSSTLPKVLQVQEASARNDLNHKINQHKQRTPSANLTKTTSPPVIQSSPMRPSPAKLSPATRAGAALQRALTEDRQLGPPLPTVTPKQGSRRNPLFGGFGERSNRELRAGLAMGELLARTQMGLHKDNSRAAPASFPAPTVSSRTRNLPTPAASQQPSSDDPQNAPTKTSNKSDTLGYKTYDDMSWKPTTPSNVQQERRQYDEMSWRLTTPQASATHTDASHVGQSTLFAQEIQKEREAVIRQIENANTSQVVVINSDREDDDSSSSIGDGQGQENVSAAQDDVMQDIGDIWQEEAERSLEESYVPHIGNQLKQHAGHKRKAAAQDVDEIIAGATPDWRDLIAEDTRPPRAKLPRTWRRESGNHFLYSDESETPKKAMSAVPSSHKPSNLHSYFQDEPDDESMALPTQAKHYQRSEKASSLVNDVSSDSLHSQRPAIGRSYMNTDLNADPSITDNQLKSTTPNATNYDLSESVVLSRSDNYEDIAEKQYVDDDLEEIFEEHKHNSNQGLSAYFSDTSDPNDQNVDEPYEHDDDQNVDATSLHQHNSHNTIIAEVVQGRDDTPISNSDGSSESHYETHEQPSSLEMSEHAASGEDHHRKSVQQVPPASGLLARFKAWLYPSPPPPQTREWTNNHHLLLGHHYQCSKLLNAPQGPIPSEFKRFVNKVYITDPEPEIYTPQQNLGLPTVYTTNDYALTASQVYAASVFCREVRERGVPLLTDGRRGLKLPWWNAEYKDENDKLVRISSLDGKAYPIRDEETGRVVRVKEEWGCRDVIIRIYLLIVQDMRDAAEAKARRAAIAREAAMREFRLRELAGAARGQLEDESRDGSNSEEDSDYGDYSEHEYDGVDDDYDENISEGRQEVEEYGDENWNDHDEDNGENEFESYNAVQTDMATELPLVMDTNTNQEAA